ncbi:MAG: glycosyltransferase [Clostridia bacterium]|nr:glycosyltransferase [Clostridia bacterium]
MEPFMRLALLSAARSIHTIRWANALCGRVQEVALFSLEAHRAREGGYV